MNDHSVGIVGLGYVGLPLALLLVKSGKNVVGVDLDPSKINKLKGGTSYVTDVSDQDLDQIMREGKLEVTTDYGRLSDVQAVIICVPTPLNDQGEPDLSYIKAAGEQIARIQRKEQLIVLESSTFPGTTEEVMLPLLEESRGSVGNDFYLAYSPERINPGDREFSYQEMPKIVSGITDRCVQQAVALYSPIYAKIISMSSPRAAEMAKVLENSQRFINISFMNEVVKTCNLMNVDIWEVIEAINSKPYGNLHFYPSSGVGGHCIPVDPLYLHWKAEQLGANLEFIQLAHRVNHSMPAYIINRIRKFFADLTVNEKSILLIGVTYKKDVADLRESSALRVMSLLHMLGAKVAYHDPLIPEVTVDGHLHRSIDLTEELLQRTDCTVILTCHSGLPLDLIQSHAKLLFDTSHSIPKSGEKNRIHYL